MYWIRFTPEIYILEINNNYHEKHNEVRKKFRTSFA